MANSGYVFKRWTKGGNQVSTSNPYEVTNITEDVTYTAVFEAQSPAPTPSPKETKKDDNKDNQSSNPKKNENTYVNPLSWSYAANQA